MAPNSWIVPLVPMSCLFHEKLAPKRNLAPSLTSTKRATYTGNLCVYHKIWGRINNKYKERICVRGMQTTSKWTLGMPAPTVLQPPLQQSTIKDGLTSLPSLFSQEMSSHYYFHAEHMDLVSQTIHMTYVLHTVFSKRNLCASFYSTVCNPHYMFMTSLWWKYKLHVQVPCISGRPRTVPSRH